MHSEATVLARARRYELAPARFFQLAVASAGALWLIAITGAAVRLTDSGLGCRHWPGCERGHPLPAKDYHAYIEFGNRAFGGIVIVLALLPALGALVTRGLPRWASRLALAAAGACLVLLVSGTLATAGGPHSGGGTEHVDRLWRLRPLVYAHAATVAVFGLTFVFVLGYLASRRERWPRLFMLALGVLGLLLVQMTIGEAQYRTHLPWPLVLVHVAFAAAVWGLLVAFVTVLWRPPAAFAPGRK